MQDTSDEASRKQAEIMLAMTPAQRFMEGIRMIEDVRFVVECSIREKHPFLQENEFRAELVKRYYSDDLTADELNRYVGMILGNHEKA